MTVTQEVLQHSDLINWTIFQELLIMDEDEAGFALSLVKTFVEQAKGIFQQMTDIINDPDETNIKLEKLSALGHYLKGSAAALGLRKVQYQCERIQNYGKMNNFDNDINAGAASNIRDWYKCCSDALRCTEKYYTESKALLGDYFNSPL